jgi:outer membrane biosynthesis protein TonB
MYWESKVSDQPTHGKPTTIRASKGGGGAGKWLLGGLAAVVLLGGGYFAWKNTQAPGQTDVQSAYNDGYSTDSTHAGPLASESASSDESATPAPASASRSTAARRSASTTQAAAVPEETIGITPVNATTDDSDIYVTAPRRPIWSHMPSQQRLTALYPQQALQRGREGEASLHCMVQGNGELACERVEETPGGFGIAAMRVAHTLRHAPQLADGSSSAGTPVNLRVVFRMADDERRRG